MDRTNQVIQSLWIGGELSTVEQLSIQSFIKNGHDYHLYIYDDVKNVPSNTTIKDGNEILPQKRIFTYQSGWGKGSYAGFADLFRYYLLAIKGGWWVDTDIVCLKPFDFEPDNVISSSFEGEWGELANNCALKLPKNSKLATSLIEMCEAKDLTQTEYGEIGPCALQKMVADLDYQKYVVPSEIFCPITWRAVSQKIVFPLERLTLTKAIELAKDQLRPLIRPKTRPGSITSRSYAVHLWNEIWRQKHLDKNRSYAKNCLYEHLKQKYL